jgi:hypothetical protein
MFKTLAQRVDDDCIQPINAVTVFFQKFRSTFCRIRHFLPPALAISV